MERVDMLNAIAGLPVEDQLALLALENERRRDEIARLAGLIEGLVELVGVRT